MKCLKWIIVSKMLIMCEFEIRVDYRKVVNNLKKINK